MKITPKGPAGQISGLIYLNSSRWIWNEIWDCFVI